MNKENDFEKFINYIVAIKTQYKELLSPFFNEKAIKNWKKIIYSLDIELWKRDRIWVFLNGDCDLEKLRRIIK